MDRVGGPIAGFGRWKTVPPAAFHSADFQPVEGAMDVFTWRCIFSVRRACLVEGMSVREASRVFGVHRDTIRKMLANATPQGYTRQRSAPQAQA